jgi:hypothetical protein
MENQNLDARPALKKWWSELGAGLNVEGFPKSVQAF